MQTLWHDIRYGLRQLRNSPGFTVVAVVILAIGISVNAVVFNLVNALLLRPLVSDRNGEVVGCYWQSKAFPKEFISCAYLTFKDIQQDRQVFSHVAVYDTKQVGLTQGDSTQRAYALIVSAGYFKTLGVGLMSGRDFLAEEENPDRPVPVAIVSYYYWEKTGGDPGLIGKSIAVNGHPCTVIGITRPGVTGTTSVQTPDIWLPLSMHETIANRGKLNNRTCRCLRLIGRLKPEMSLSMARARIQVLGEQLESVHPNVYQRRLLTPAPLPHIRLTNTPATDASAWRFSMLPAALAGVILLIACLNLANLMLARGSMRQQEMAARHALGAGRGRVLRQLLVENSLIALLGSLAGLGISLWICALLSSILKHIELMEGILLKTTPDIRVLTATVGFCTFSLMLFGLCPAIKLSRPDRTMALRLRGGSSLATKPRRGLTAPRHVLVAGQLAMSLILLTVAGCLISSYVKFVRADPDFESRGHIMAEIDAGIIGYSKTDTLQVYRQLSERLSTISGIEAVSMAWLVPLSVSKHTVDVQTAGALDEDPSEDEAITVRCVCNSVGTRYIQSLGLPLLRGRDFTWDEVFTEQGPRVALIDEPLARQLFPNEDPLGQYIRHSEDSSAMVEVVGIVPGLRHSLGDHNPVAHIYLPLGQRFSASMTLHIKVAVPNPEAVINMIPLVRQTIRSVDPRLPVLGIRTMNEHLMNNIGMNVLRLGTSLLIGFAGIALILAATAVYSVTSYLVARQTRDIGIRIALGATPWNALQSVLIQGLKQIALGIGLGLPLAWLSVEFMNRILYGISPAVPSAFILAILCLAGAVMMACFIPARRAAKIDPMEALRYEC